MATLTIQATGVTNNFIHSENPTDTGGGTDVSLGIGNTGTATYRQPIKFALTDIPSGSTINSAVLTIVVSSDLATNARTLRAFRLLRAWVVSQTSWNNYSTGNAWGTAGAGNTSSDREATDIGTTTQPANPSVGDLVVINLTPSKVQEMIPGGTFVNNGLLLQVDTESEDLLLYRSTNYTTDPTLKPKLVVDYTLGGGSDDLYGESLY